MLLANSMDWSFSLNMPSSQVPASSCNMWWYINWERPTHDTSGQVMLLSIGVLLYTNPSQWPLVLSHWQLGMYFRVPLESSISGWSGRRAGKFGKQSVWLPLWLASSSVTLLDLPYAGYGISAILHRRTASEDSVTLSHCIPQMESPVGETI